MQRAPQTELYLRARRRFSVQSDNKSTGISGLRSSRGWFKLDDACMGYAEPNNKRPPVVHLFPSLQEWGDEAIESISSAMKLLAAQPYHISKSAYTRLRYGAIPH
ncbi:hypothetical protein DL766_008299 [Monosporascus sp. MC13-8B]|uniref:Uncharacterized protein n=1 Tax=Monosporascus cannonballus TaxID=155416 RepID=A0ABY0H399_9PEZI|nr:hypothetical protein DL762_007562 [Monosporascus cannonballus]RYO99489.1 hypothetical protein DL763_001513 [Monosporascus cannonballus]RYP20024.1 hypothetical protein DL766_008299 [Monosporascus sp. MC13-8B]